MTKSKAKKSKSVPVNRAICIYCNKRKSLSKLTAVPKENKSLKPIYLCNPSCILLFGYQFRKVVINSNHVSKYSYKSKT